MGVRAHQACKRRSPQLRIKHGRRSSVFEAAVTQIVVVAVAVATTATCCLLACMLMRTPMPPRPRRSTPHCCALSQSVPMCGGLVRRVVVGEAVCMGHIALLLRPFGTLSTPPKNPSPSRLTLQQLAQLLACYAPDGAPQAGARGDATSTTAQAPAAGGADGGSSHDGRGFLAACHTALLAALPEAYLLPVDAAAGVLLRLQRCGALAAGRGAHQPAAAAGAQHALLDALCFRLGDASSEALSGLAEALASGSLQPGASPISKELSAVLGARLMVEPDAFATAWLLRVAEAAAAGAGPGASAGGGGDAASAMAAGGPRAADEALLTQAAAAPELAAGGRLLRQLGRLLAARLGSMRPCDAVRGLAAFARARHRDPLLYHRAAQVLTARHAEFQVCAVHVPGPGGWAGLGRGTPFPSPAPHTHTS